MRSKKFEKRALLFLAKIAYSNFSKKKPYFDRTNAELHLIGHLQTNKVKQVVGNCSLIQSVDSIRLAKLIADISVEKGICQDILLEVNIGCDPNKYGFSVEQLLDAVYEINSFHGIKIKGLMTIPPIGPLKDTESIFAELRKLFVDIKDKKIDNVFMEILSMGMSSDYQAAIRQGATLIRLGTILFHL